MPSLAPSATVGADRSIRGLRSNAAGSCAKHSDTSTELTLSLRLTARQPDGVQDGLAARAAGFHTRVLGRLP